MTNLACAACVTESAGAGRPPAVTIHDGTALCVEHLLERTRPKPAVEIHTMTDPACRFYLRPRGPLDRLTHNRMRGYSCRACMAGPKSGGSENG